jgi:hypothetical protein
LGWQFFNLADNSVSLNIFFIDYQDNEWSPNKILIFYKVNTTNLWGLLFAFIYDKWDLLIFETAKAA